MCSQLSARIYIERVLLAASGAICSGNQRSIPNIRADFPCFDSKIAEHWRYLPVVKLSLLIGVTLGAFLLVQLLLAWWNGLVLAALGPFVDFDVTGILPVAYALCALVLGVAVGTVVRRSISAMALTLALFVGLQVGLVQLRTSFLPTVTSMELYQQPDPHIRDWIVFRQLVDRMENPAGDRVCRNVPPSDQMSCTQSSGIHFLTTYHPASQYWLLQGIESAILVLIAAALFALTLWWVRHRVH